MLQKLFIFSVFLLSIQKASATDINVALIIASSEQDIFWSQVSKITHATANDLNVNLQTHYHASNRILLDEVISDIVHAQKKPDYVIFMPFGGSLERTFSLLEDAKISFVTLERTYEQQLHVEKIGNPLERFKYWIGEVFYNNTKAGELLAQNLLTHAVNNRQVKKSSLTALGLSGDFHSGSKKREKGFLNIAQQNSIEVKQLIYTHWQQNVAKEKLLKLMNRHGNVDIIWCGSDVNSLGALEAISELKLNPNKDIVIGGFDWAVTALQKIENKQLTASVGGHIFEGARALIKIFDYHHGIDNFNRDADYSGYLLELIDVNNIKEYEQLTKPNNWEDVDFRMFSSAKQKRPTAFNTLNIISSLNKQ